MKIEKEIPGKVYKFGLKLREEITLDYYPGTEPGYMIYKRFSAPYTDVDYYKKVSYLEVFKAVEKQIQKGLYNEYLPIPLKSLLSSPQIKKALTEKDEGHIVAILQYCISTYPDFFKSDLPIARELIGYFGEFINRFFFSVSSKERQEAKDVIHDQLLSKPKEIINAKKVIPPYLYLNGMYAYLHEITKYLETQYKNHFGNEPPDIPKLDREDLSESELRKADPRLIEIAKNGYIDKLINEPKELTKKLMADFFGRTLGGLKQELKEEKHFSKSPEKAPAYLIHKHQKR